jgi:hypothetical protein
MAFFWIKSDIPPRYLQAIRRSKKSGLLPVTFLTYAALKNFLVLEIAE